ncbi:MAG: UPF0175 family protein [Phycisphaeraceae bacterium]
MTITIDIPADLERHLRQGLGDLGRAAKESLLVHAYRQGKLSRPELAAALEVDRLELAALLQRHEVTEGTLTHDDLDEQRRTLDRVLGPLGQSC